MSTVQVNNKTIISSLNPNATEFVPRINSKLNPYAQEFVPGSKQLALANNNVSKSLNNLNTVVQSFYYQHPNMVRTIYNNIIKKVHASANKIGINMKKPKSVKNVQRYLQGNAKPYGQYKWCITKIYHIPSLFDHNHSVNINAIYDPSENMWSIEEHWYIYCNDRQEPYKYFNFLYKSNNKEIIKDLDHNKRNKTLQSLVLSC